jgi:hypothetical protein
MARPANRPFHTSSHGLYGSNDIPLCTVADSLSYHDVQTEPGQVTADRDTWLYEMHSEVDMEYFSSLSQLSLLVKRSQASSYRIDDYETLLQSYKQQKADIVRQACLRYSDELLQKGSESVGS